MTICLLLGKTIALYVRWRDSRSQFPRTPARSSWNNDPRAVNEYGKERLAFVDSSFRATEARVTIEPKPYLKAISLIK